MCMLYTFITIKLNIYIYFFLLDKYSIFFKFFIKKKKKNTKQSLLRKYLNTEIKS